MIEQRSYYIMNETFLCCLIIILTFYFNFVKLRIFHETLTLFYPHFKNFVLNFKVKLSMLLIGLSHVLLYLKVIKNFFVIPLSLHFCYRFLFFVLRSCILTIKSLTKHPISSWFSFCLCLQNCNLILHQIVFYYQ
jgi:hypothetical protein